MADNPVIISGMIGGTYFADSPVVVNISGFQFDPDSSMRVVKVGVKTLWEAPAEDSPDTAAIQFRARTQMESLFGSTITSNVLLNRVVSGHKNPILSTQDLLTVGGTYGGSILYVVLAKTSPSGVTLSRSEVELWMANNLTSRSKAVNLASVQAHYSNHFLSEYTNFGVQVMYPQLFVLQRMYYIDAYTPPSASDDEDLTYEADMDFRAEVGADTSIAFDISTALRAMWAGYTFGDELRAAQDAASGAVNNAQVADRACQLYKVVAGTEWILNGIYYEGEPYEASEISYGLLGGWTELERYTGTGQPNIESLIGYVPSLGRAAVLASTKPNTPEVIGQRSIVSEGFITYEDGSDDSDSSSESSRDGVVVIHKQVFHPCTERTADTDFSAETFAVDGHTYVRNTDNDYIDFLFINSRGAMESCSAMMKESLRITVESEQYSHVERPTFVPSRSMLAIAENPRRSWLMSSGYQDREWAEWWATEFLRSRRWWMLVNGRYLPIVVSASDKDVTIYDKTKPSMSHVDFTVTLGLGG